jgi:hypothetical protein
MSFLLNQPKTFPFSWLNPFSPLSSNLPPPLSSCSLKKFPYSWSTLSFS